MFLQTTSLLVALGHVTSIKVQEFIPISSKKLSYTVTIRIIDGSTGSVGDATSAKLFSLHSVNPAILLCHLVNL